MTVHGVYVCFNNWFTLNVAVKVDLEIKSHYYNIKCIVFVEENLYQTAINKSLKTQYNHQELTLSQRQLSFLLLLKGWDGAQAMLIKVSYRTVTVFPPSISCSINLPIP